MLIWQAYSVKPKHPAFLLLCDCTALRHLCVSSFRLFKDYLMQPGQVGLWGWSKPNRFFKKDQKLAITWSISQCPDLGLCNRLFALLWLWKSAGDLQKGEPSFPKVPLGWELWRPRAPSFLVALRHKQGSLGLAMVVLRLKGTPSGLEFGKQHGFCKSPRRALCPLAVSQTKGPCLLIHETAIHHLGLPDKC